MFNVLLLFYSASQFFKTFYPLSNRPLPFESFIQSFFVTTICLNIPYIITGRNVDTTAFTAIALCLKKAQAFRKTNSALIIGNHGFGFSFVFQRTRKKVPKTA